MKFLQRLLDWIAKPCSDHCYEYKSCCHVHLAHWVSLGWEIWHQDVETQQYILRRLKESNKTV